MYDYEETCPVSKAASLLCERWTLQIIRELSFGANRFSELQRYLPKLSPTLLNTRLRSLEQQGLVIRRKVPEKKGSEYLLTPMGQAVMPIVQEMGKWGMQWAFDCLDPAQINVAMLIRDYAGALRVEQLPDGDITIQFTVAGGGDPLKRFVLVRKRSVQVCDENIGNDVDLYLSADPETFGRIWYGELGIEQACAHGKLLVVGNRHLKTNIGRWLGTSQFAALNARAAGRGSQGSGAR